MSTETEEIKNRLDVVELVQSYVRLEKSGMNWRACCPFHSEKSPSFFVSPTRQTWHCFGGCAEGGDIFSFVQKIEGVDFREALELLAKRAGVTLHHEDPQMRSERNRLYLLCDEAAKYFAAALTYYPAAGAYLARRGILPETIKQFRIGYVPDGWRNLIGALGKKGFTPDEMEKVGLAIRSEKGFYDRYRNRIMFPIADSSGRVVGFGGRIFEEGKPASTEKDVSTEAKYINSPQTVLYDKSRILYAFDKAKRDILKENACVIVEGYMDAVMSHQAGVANTISVSGTALTIPQIQMIRRLADTVISSFDADKAGELATKRSLDLAASAGFNRLVAVIPKGGGKDPADVVARSADEWREIVKNAKPVVDFFFERACALYDKRTPSGKTDIARAVLGEVRNLENEIERSHWVRVLAKELEVEEDAIWGELMKINTEPRADLAHAEAAQPKSRRRRLEELVLGLLLLHPEKAEGVRKLFSDIDTFLTETVGASHGKFFPDMMHQSVFSMTKEGEGTKSVPTSGSAETTAKDDAFVKDLIFQTEIMLGHLDEREQARELEQAPKYLAKEVLTLECDRLQKEISVAEKRGDPELGGLMDQYQKVTQKKETLA